VYFLQKSQVTKAAKPFFHRFFSIYVLLGLRVEIIAKGLQTTAIRLKRLPQISMQNTVHCQQSNKNQIFCGIGNSIKILHPPTIHDSGENSSFLLRWFNRYCQISNPAVLHCWICDLANSQILFNNESIMGFDNTHNMALCSWFFGLCNRQT
jgi:hypothetical protein